MGLNISKYLCNSNLQTQHKKCDMCNSDNINYEYAFINNFRQGDVYFSCDKGHSFRISTFGLKYWDAVDMYKTSIPT